jgi:hypothetical protein
VPPKKLLAEQQKAAENLTNSKSKRWNFSEISQKNPSCLKSWAKLDLQKSKESSNITKNLVPPKKLLAEQQKAAENLTNSKSKKWNFCRISKKTFSKFFIKNLSQIKTGSSKIQGIFEYHKKIQCLQKIFFLPNSKKSSRGI